MPLNYELNQTFRVNIKEIIESIKRVHLMDNQ